MMTVVTSPMVEKSLKKGIQRLDGKDFPSSLNMDELVFLKNQSGYFLGTAYLSKQHKGVGWFLSPSKLALTQDYFEGLFATSRDKRRSYEQDSSTTAYRLFNQDGDNFGGLTIDRYGDFAVFSWYNSFVYKNRQMIVSAFRTIYPDLKGAYEKIRFNGMDYDSKHLYGQEAPETFTVLENGVCYSVFLNDGLMTGIFLDQHDVRGALIDGMACGKKVLNLFSYTAAFSVAAAMGGASETISVDLAKRSKDLSQAHFDANGFSTDDHQFVVMDVFDYLKYAKRHGFRFDLIIIDPPSFARNKKQTFSVVKDYHKLITQALDILSPSGTIIASTNASNLSLSQFLKGLQKGMGERLYDVVDIKRLPADFAINEQDESSNYLKVVTLQVKV